MSATDARDTIRYRAFISYKHADLRRRRGVRPEPYGRWLHRRLEAYKIPGVLIGQNGDDGFAVPSRLFPLFIDRAELASDDRLGPSIEEALRASSHLIVICSPGAAKSRWVNEEILFFKRLGRGTRIVALIVDGEPNARDPSQECFPPALHFRLGPDLNLSDEPTEPLAADAREEGDGEHDAVLKVVAGLLGVGLDQIKRRDAEARRWAARRFAAIATALIAVFAGLAGAAGWFAYESGVERQHAQDNMNIAANAANDLVVDLSDEFSGTTGVRYEVGERILARAREIVDRLSQDQDLSPMGRRVRAFAQMRSSENAVALGKYDDASQFAGDALASFRTFYNETPSASTKRDLAIALDRVGVVNQKLYQIDTARADFAEGLAIVRDLFAKNGTARDERNIEVFLSAIAQIDQEDDRLEAARKGFDESLQTARDLDKQAGTSDSRDGVATALENLGSVDESLGDFEAARLSYEEEVKISEARQEQSPTPDSRRGYSLSLQDISRIDLDEGHPDEAMAEAQKSLDIARAIDSDVSTPQTRNDIVQALDNVGQAKRVTGDARGARIAYAEGLEIARAVDKAANTILTQRVVAQELNNLGATDEEIPDLPLALSEFSGALDIARGLMRESGRPWTLAICAIVLEGLGRVERTQQHWDDAKTRMNESLDLFRRIAADRASPHNLSTFAVSLVQSARLALDSGDRAAGCKDLREAEAPAEQARTGSDTQAAEALIVEIRERERDALCLFP